MYMIQYFVRHSIGETFQKVTTPPARSVWVFGNNITQADLDEVEERYGMDGNILRDVLDKHELPRVEANHAGLYVFVRVATRTPHGDLVTSPLLLAVKGSVFVSLSAGEHGEHSDFAAKVPVRSNDSIGLLLAMFASVVSEYESLMQQTAKYIKDTGRRLQTHDVTNADFIHFVTIESNLNEYHMNLSNMLVVSERLYETIESPGERESLGDILLHIRQNLVAIDSHTQNVASIRNAYSTIANNILNQRMKTLTALTVLIALPNVFYGMYGMNVALPFQDAPIAFLVIFSFTVLLILTVYILAKRFKVF